MILWRWKFLMCPNLVHLKTWTQRRFKFYVALNHLSKQLWRRRSGIKVKFRIDSLTEVKRVFSHFPAEFLRVVLCLIPKMPLSKESKDVVRGMNWSYKETRSLINIRSDTNIQEEFEKKEFLKKCKDARPNITAKMYRHLLAVCIFPRNAKRKHLFQK